MTNSFPLVKNSIAKNIRILRTTMHFCNIQREKEQNTMLIYKYIT